MNAKCATKLTAGENKLQYKRKYYMTMEFPCRHCRKQTSGTLLSSIASDHVFLTNFLPEMVQTRIYLWFLRDGAPTYFLLAVWEIFKQRVSGGKGRMRWINRMSCSFS